VPQVSFLRPGIPATSHCGIRSPESLNPAHRIAPFAPDAARTYSAPKIFLKKCPMLPKNPVFFFGAGARATGTWG
jgi:hypothetical protein